MMPSSEQRIGKYQGMKEMMKEMTKAQEDAYIDTIMKMQQLISNFSESTPLHLVNPHFRAVVDASNLWKLRKVYGEDKLLLLNIEFTDENSKHKELIVQLLQNIPSIVLNINGTHYPSVGIIKSHELKYFEGTKDRMLIYEQWTHNIYEGQVDDIQAPQPHGKGTFHYRSNAKQQAYYQGDFNFGVRQGLGILHEKSSLYEGQWKNDKKHGFGKEEIWKRKKKVVKPNKSQKEVQNSNQTKTEEQASSSKIESKEEIQPEQEQGQGENKIKSNKVEEGPHNSHEQKKESVRVTVSNYEGNFSEGLRSGRGIDQTKYGTYDGQWLQGAKNGQGVMKYKTGAVYKGEWKNNNFEGQGNYVDQAGNMYEGSFENGRYNGQGTMKYANRDTYQGEWLDGQKHGQGIYTYDGDDYYEGTWVKDAAEGEGTSMIDGNFYTGEFSKGRRHGLGEITDEEGVTKKGIWKLNELIEVIAIDGEVVE